MNITVTDDGDCWVASYSDSELGDCALRFPKAEFAQDIVHPIMEAAVANARDAAVNMAMVMLGSGAVTVH